MKHLVSVGCFIDDIPGTVLCTSDTFSEDLKEGWTRHKCSIGYQQFNDDRKEWTFVPVLDLPSLKNDRYIVTCRNGVLTVKTAKGKSLVVALNLKNLAPGLITKKSAEQDGTDQPATAPESGAEGKEKTKPESEVRPQ